MINLRIFTLIILAAAISGVLTPAARATLIIFNNRTAFNSAGPGLPVETFENNLRPNNTVTTFPEPLNSTSNNVAFALGRILPGINLSVSPGRILVLVNPIAKQMIFHINLFFCDDGTAQNCPNVKNNVTRWREPFVEITFLKETQESSKTVDGPTARR